MIKHLRIGESISSFGNQLNLKGKEMLIKDDSTYVEGKGWVSIPTRERILNSYSIKEISNPVLLPMLSDSPFKEPSYEQKLMDKAALKFLSIHAKYAEQEGATDAELANWAYESAKAFMREREKWVLKSGE